MKVFVFDEHLEIWVSLNKPTHLAFHYFVTIFVCACVWFIRNVVIFSAMGARNHKLPSIIQLDSCCFAKWAMGPWSGTDERSQHVLVDGDERGKRVKSCYSTDRKGEILPANEATWRFSQSQRVSFGKIVRPHSAYMCFLASRSAPVQQTSWTNLPGQSFRSTPTTHEIFNLPHSNSPPPPSSLVSYSFLSADGYGMKNVNCRLKPARF